MNRRDVLKSGIAATVAVASASALSASLPAPPPKVGIRKETDSLGEVDVASDKLWGAQTQRSLEHFDIGIDLMPREMIASYATLKKAAAIANHKAGRLKDEQYNLIVKVDNKILAGQHADMLSLHVWMTGSATQFNMNFNKVISNRCCQFAGTPVGSKKLVHPNDHVNMAQSLNDTFPSAMSIAVAITAKRKLMPSVDAMAEAISDKAEAWKDIVKVAALKLGFVDEAEFDRFVVPSKMGAPGVALAGD
jgi:fumarate hydratase class II